MRVLLLGSLPPPVGGVTASVRNLQLALRARGVTAEVVGMGSLLRRWDLAHVHYTRSWKRLLGVVVGRLLARRVAFTVHNGRIEAFGRLDALAVKLTDRVVLLNDSAYRRARDSICGDKAVRMANFYAEGLREGAGRKVDLDPEKRHALLYAYDRWEYEGRDVYGIPFVLDNLAAFGPEWKLVLVDPKNRYSTEAAAAGDRVLHLAEPVNFLRLLRDVDLYVRPTSTDGASIAVQEALCVGTPVLASDAVERPQPAYLYAWGDAGDFVRAVGAIDRVAEQEYAQQTVQEYLDAFGPDPTQ